ncbi:MAG TPA: peptide chain release factor N(5)-glutamine methyltransferase [Vitreimonas sp.]|uniref:peptide chain release factor N(5)-glutamine methyltransferase n=1 Tax=Vitreimonas sp. TaxID=3069702 RepID=UPI002D3463DB|nr:peptide chain release factor N(5)-glutamine methyltransferase [Vitreimonas sp.]HYD85853.1 peptide chain release factor N(5)-glutamine methyltransferase [Vitreimonas sp.]
MTTLVSLWTDLRKRLEAAGVDTPVIDARLLLEAGAGVQRLDIVTDPRRSLSDAQVAAVEALALRRLDREPIGHILGRKAFWTLDLEVNADVLSPRPETELLVETALEILPKDKRARVLDLGVGSGAILLAILAERPFATGVGVDISDAALAVAKRNAEKLGFADRLELRSANWCEGLAHTFDLVVSNPPYIPTADIEGLEPEVARFEPRPALDGGADGLDAYRIIIAALPRLLAPYGAFAFEVGRGQADAVQALAQAGGLATETPRLDLAGIARVVAGRRAA